MSLMDALLAGRAEAERLGYPPIDDRIFYAFERALSSHPVLCAATTPVVFAPRPGHLAHTCTHPAVPQGVTGRAVHLCECGTTWEVLP